MANALHFTGTGDASVPGCLWDISTSGGIGAVEFYLKSTGSNQALFSSASKFTVGSNLLGTCGLIVWMDGKGLINVQDSATALSKTVVTNYVGNVAVNDGSWHLVSLYSDGQGYHLYVDGASVTLRSVSSSTEDHPMELVLMRFGAQTGSVHFGADAYNPTPVAPAYSGLMSELRLWQGGSPGFVLTPAFSLNVGVPVATDTPNLSLYWPLWTNQANPLVDLISKTALVLQGPGVVTNVGQYYNDLSEVICNATMAPFDPFTAGTTGAAFTYIVQQAKLGGYSPTTFRQLYLQQSYANSFATWFTMVGKVTYPGSGQPAFTQADFAYVQGRLLDELEAVETVWGFYQTAYDNLGFLAAQYQLAAGTVYSTLFSGEASITTPAQSNLGSIINAVASIAGLIPGTGKIIAGVLKGAWTVIGFTQPKQGDQPNFTSSLMVEGQASNLDGAVNAAIAAMYGAVQSSIAVILGNWGLLDTVNQRIDQGEGFVFGPGLDPTKNPDLANLNSVYNAAVIALSKLVLCGGYPLYVFYRNQYGAWSFPFNYVVQAPLFAISWGQGPDPWHSSPFTFGGEAVVGYRQAAGQRAGDNGYPSFVSLAGPAQQLLQGAAQALNNQTFQQAELLGWPFQKQFPTS